MHLVWCYYYGNLNRGIDMNDKIARFDVTENQRKWVDNKALETGEGIASVMRGLIQDKINKDKRVRK